MPHSDLFSFFEIQFGGGKAGTLQNLHNEQEKATKILSKAAQILLLKLLINVS